MYVWVQRPSNRVRSAGFGAIGYLVLIGIAAAQQTPWPTAPSVWTSGGSRGSLELTVIAPAAGLGDAEALGLRMPADVEAIAIEEIVEPPLSKKPWSAPGARVLVVANSTSPVPGAVIEAVLDQLGKGRGVVWVSYDGSGVFDDTALKTLTEVTDSEALLRGILLGGGGAAARVRLFEGKKARFVAISFPAAAPLTHCLVPTPDTDSTLYAGEYESAMALPVRAALWASGETPAVHITGVDMKERRPVDPEEAPPGLSPEELALMADLSGLPQLTSFTLNFDRPTPQSYSVTARIRYPELGLARTYTDSVSKGVATHEIQLPAGYRAFVLDFLLTDGGRTVDWYSRRGSESGWPVFGSVRFANAAVSPNDTISVTTSIPPHPVTPAGGTVWLRVSDSFGRSVGLARTPFPAAGGEVTVRGDVSDLLTPAVLVETYAIPDPATGLGTWAIPRAAADLRTMHVDVGRRDVLAFAARVSFAHEWGVFDHCARLREAGVGVVVGASDARARHRIRELGLFDEESVDGLQLSAVEVAAARPEEVSFAMWRGLLEGSDGIEFVGVELPGFALEQQTAAAWQAATETMAAIRGGMDVLMTAAELSARGIVSGEDEAVFPDELDVKVSKFTGEWFEFRIGEGIALAFLAAPDSERAQVEVRAASGLWAYAPGSTEASYGSRSVDLSPSAGQAVWAILLPYEASRLIGEVPRAVEAGTALNIGMSLKTRERLPDRHVFHCEIAREYSDPIAYYSRAVEAPAGAATIAIPLALNETLGRYEVRMRDVLTGLTAEGWVTVLAPNL